MKKLKIKSELLSLEEQIEILEIAREEVNERRRGLCGIISKVINRVSGTYERRTYPYCSYVDVDLFIPLFTRQNAVKYGNGVNDMYWWKHRYKHDFESRINFLNWMIRQIKKEINNGKATN